MIFLSVLYFTLRATGATTPVLNQSPEIFARASTNDTACPAIENLGGVPFQTNYRSLTDILWTCWVTVFACTWVSVHPNLRGHRPSKLAPILQRVEMMTWGIIAPELLVVFALRQWRGARAIHKAITNIIKEKRDTGELSKTPPWTMTHSHFLQMGGYVFESRGQLRYIDVIPIISPDPNEIYELGNGEDEGEPLEQSPTASDKTEALNALLSNPGTTEEIEDRSKGDALSKGFALLQTLWFVVQCIARHAQGLATTELELTTVAYAILSAMIYFCWWHKPLDVGCPIVVSIPSATGSVPSENGGEGEGPDGYVDVVTEKGDPVSPSPTGVLMKLDEYLSQRYPMNRVSVRLEGRSTVIRLPALVITALVSWALLLGLRFESILHENKLPGESFAASSAATYPTFYAWHRWTHFSMTGIPHNVAIPAAILASIFGSIHCIAWSWKFSTSTLQLLWRIGSLFICVSPLLGLLIVPVESLLHKLAHIDDNSKSATLLQATVMVLTTMVLFAVTAYGPVRIALLVISLIELKDLPPSAFQTVEWTEFLPHI